MDAPAPVLGCPAVFGRAASPFHRLRGVEDRALLDVPVIDTLSDGTQGELVTLPARAQRRLRTLEPRAQLLRIRGFAGLRSFRFAECAFRQPEPQASGRIFRIRLSRSKGL